MNQSIRKYFKGIAAKRLSEVEIRPSRSNQHEFNGTSMMRELLGSERRVLETTFLFISDDENSKASEDSTTTWYDAR